MGADTLLPENACRKEGYRRMYSVHLEQKPYIVPLPLMHIRLRYSFVSYRKCVAE